MVKPTFLDTFSSSSELLTSHKSDSGGTWTNGYSINSGGASIIEYFLQREGGKKENAGFIAIANPARKNPDYSISARIVSSGAADDTTTLVVRWLDENNTYAWRTSRTYDSNSHLLKRVAGTWTILDSSCTLVANEDIIKLQVSGSSIKAFKNNIEVCSAVDSSLTQAGHGGVGFGAFYQLSDDLQNQIIDDFKIEPISKVSFNTRSVPLIFKNLFASLLGVFGL